jgi:hypothetical protein
MPVLLSRWRMTEQGPKNEADGGAQVFGQLAF